MRSIAGLFLIMMLFASLAVAGEKPRGNGQRNYPHPQIVIPQDGQSSRNFTWSTRPFVMQEFRSSSGENVCYTMRSIIVAKEPGSDVTRVVGQRTCTPASRFRMNHSAPQPR